MLPLSHQQSYTEFAAALEALKKAIAGSNQEQKTIEDCDRKVQQVYQDRIVPLMSESVSDDITSRWRSLQTEVNRSFRLLRTDIIFLKASRQSSTTQQRLSTCLTRIDQLMKYCQELNKL